MRLAAGALLLLFVLGLGLVYLVYGQEAASFGLFCLLAGLTPVVLIVLLFFAIDWILRRGTPK